MEGPGIDDIQPVPRPAPRPRQHENPAILPPGRGAGVSLIQGDWTIDISIGFTLNLVWRTLYKGWGVPPEVPGHWWVRVSLWSYLRLTICHSTQPPLPHLLIWCWPGAEGPRSHIWYNCGHRAIGCQPWEHAVMAWHPDDTALWETKRYQAGIHFRSKNNHFGGGFVSSCQAWKRSWHLETHIIPFDSWERPLNASKILEKAYTEHAGSVCLISHCALTRGLGPGGCRGVSRVTSHQSGVTIIWKSNPISGITKYCSLALTDNSWEPLISQHSKLHFLIWFWIMPGTQTYHPLNVTMDWDADPHGYWY